MFLDNAKTLFANNGVKFNINIQPSFQKNFELLADNLVKSSEDGYTTFILTHNKAQIERIQNIVHSIKPGSGELFEHVQLSIHQGFVDHDAKVAPLIAIELELCTNAVTNIPTKKQIYLFWVHLLKILSNLSFANPLTQSINISVRIKNRANQTETYNDLCKLR